MYSFGITEFNRKTGDSVGGLSFTILSKNNSENEAVLDMLQIVLPFYKSNPDKTYRISMCETEQTKSDTVLPPVVMSYTDWKNVSKIFYLGNMSLRDIIAQHNIGDVEIEERECTLLPDGELADVLSGYCKSTADGELISLDGDSYSYDRQYFLYQVEFSMSASGVAHELTVWMDSTPVVKEAP